MKINDIVKPGKRTIENARQTYLGTNRCYRARAEWEKQEAKRGRITAIDHKGVVVEWEDGSVYHCLDYMIQLA